MNFCCSSRKTSKNKFFGKKTTLPVFMLVVTGMVWYNDRKPICENVFANIMKVLREEY